MAGINKKEGGGAKHEDMSLGVESIEIYPYTSREALYN